MSDAAHYGVVPCLDDDPPAVALYDAGGEEGHVPGLQHRGVTPLRAQGHCLALPRQAGVVHLENKTFFIKLIKSRLYWYRGVTVLLPVWVIWK